MDRNPPTWDSPTIREVLGGKKGATVYQDPVDGRTYLAGYAPLPKIGWGALVQHDYEAALQPIEELKSQMVRIGWITLAAVGLITSGLWGWLIWMLRREESVAHG